MNPFYSASHRFSCPPLPSANSPIFILSSIWRSGSTALQRTLISDPSIQVWGEPYSDCNLISSLSRSAMALTQSHWPQPGHFLHNFEIKNQPENHFIANWYPPMQSMIEAHRAMLDRLFKQSAEELGKQRFGIKFVRLGLEELHYLQWIYPDAKFILLIRNPWDCWRSYKGYSWVYRWPKGTVTTVQQFAKLWEKQSKDLLTHPITEHVRVLRYEDFLEADFNWDAFKEFCQLPEIRPNILEKRISGVNTPPQPVTDSDNAIIQQICGSLASALGYHGPKNTDTSIVVGDWRQ